ncbi:MAG: hypothetical protein ACKVZJ_10480 [Phycisphaerales bacterium]
MSLPVHDWQFWVVTLLVLAAAVYLVWQVVGAVRARRGRARRATLTVGGRPVGEKR